MWYGSEKRKKKIFTRKESKKREKKKETQASGSINIIRFNKRAKENKEEIFAA